MTAQSAQWSRKFLRLSRIIFDSSLQQGKNFIYKRNLNSQVAFIQAIKRLRIASKPVPFVTPLAFLSFSSQTKPNKMSSEKPSLDDLLQNADQLFDENQYQEALDELAKYTGEPDATVLWRRARALYKLSSTSKEKKNDCINEGYAVIEQALALDDKNYACHKWMAVLLDAKSELEGIKERVTQLERVKKHMLAAVELNPEDPTSWHCLGNFAFGLADMPWYQRKVVSTIFATPPSGTYEEALEHFLKAEEKKPNFYSMNLLFIGKCYYALKNYEKAKEYLQRAAEVHVLNEDDKKCKDEATALLKKV